ncbi:MAG: hypothetical protein H7Y20_14770 [Bryobacteraceae bacterium]|nr:hypothetical protein [Bryobacteraceae bacterium]
MSSLKRAEAARRNGSLSRGPVTELGKTRSSQNAAKHGMYSHAFVLTNESPELFDQIVAKFMDDWQPVAGQETDLVGDIVIARWRLHRILTIETATIDHEMDVQRPQIERDIENIDEPTRASLAFTALADNSRSLSLLNRFEGRLRRTISQATESLERLQEKRFRKMEKRENEPNVSA